MKWKWSSAVKFSLNSVQHKLCSLHESATKNFVLHFSLCCEEKMCYASLPFSFLAGYITSGFASEIQRKAVQIKQAETHKRIREQFK